TNTTEHTRLLGGSKHPTCGSTRSRVTRETSLRYVATISPDKAMLPPRSGAPAWATPSAARDGGQQGRTGPAGRYRPRSQSPSGNANGVLSVAPAFGRANRAQPGRLADRKRLPAAALQGGGGGRCSLQLCWLTLRLRIAIG